MPAPAPGPQVHDIIRPVVAAAGLHLEEVEVTRAGGRTVVRVVVDLDEDEAGGVDLDRITDVSRDISAVLDASTVVAGEHTLEVSSPGVARVLTERRHFVRARGRVVALRLTSGQVVRGRLTEVDRSGDDPVLVVLPEVAGVKGRPAKVGPPVRIHLSGVQDGQVEVEMSRLGPDPEEDVADDELDGSEPGSDEDVAGDPAEEES